MHTLPRSPLALTLPLWRSLATALAALLLSVSALAAPLSTQEVKNVRAVIQAQLAAFAADDAVKAFSYAAPNVRKSVASAEHFMAMVRGQYAVVYRPASVAFMQPERDGDMVVQPVQMSDAEGVAWLAVYTLQRQKNKQWRITGCFVQGTNGRMA
ncbi:MAG: DUF4864 domain-containing protein [Rhodoferax sp.]|uniref:DUF4864 domain-containing protein n=1 Tax=Rhodoferax sp. TaxID=50421 RepID=UPI0032679620